MLISQIKSLNEFCIKIPLPLLLHFQRNKPSKRVTVVLYNMYRNRSKLIISIEKKIPSPDNKHLLHILGEIVKLNRQKNIEKKM